MTVTKFLRVIFSYFKQSYFKAIFIFIILLLQMAFNALIPLSFKYIIDYALLGQNHYLLLMILSGMGGGAVVIFLLGLWGDYLYARVITDILRKIRLQVFQHLQRLSIDFYSRYKVGDVLSRFSGDLSVVENALNSAISCSILPSLEIIGTSVLLFTLEWRLALIAMLVWPFTLIGPRFFAPRATSASYRRKEDEANTISTVHEYLVNQPVVKGFSLEKTGLKSFENNNNILARSTQRVCFLGSMVQRSATVGVMLLQVFVMVAGAYMASQNYLSIGTLAAFQTLFLNLSLSILWITEYLPTLFQATGGMQRIQEILKEEPRVLDCPSAVILPRFSHKISFNEVSFSYAGDKLNLCDAKFSISRGWNVAFVGPSGSGKSTVLNLLVRFYDPTKGLIRIDEHALNSITQESLRSQMGIVFQESLLFNISIRENIRLGKLDATDEEIIAAARAAEIHDYIMTLEHGYDTLIGEKGNRLSGGQRQRLAIARAIVRNPEILILDEATSALDPSTETAINETLKRIRKGRTVITVTHRLAPIVLADRIFVLDQGRVVEDGSHEDLTAKNGIYAQLWQKQSGFSINSAEGRAVIMVERLQRIPIFCEIDPVILTEVAHFFYSEQVPEGRVVIQEGDTGDVFYILVHGKVEVLKTGTDGRQCRVAVLQDGDHFGEIALLKSLPRTATILTLTPCILLSLRREYFDRLLAKTPYLREKLEQTFQARTRNEKRMEDKIFV